MKVSASNLDLFALTRHLASQQSPNPEHGRRRLRTWDELGTASLADQITGFGGEVAISAWQSKTPNDIELSEPVVEFVLAGLKQPMEGAWADILTRLMDRLEAAKK